MCFSYDVPEGISYLLLLIYIIYISNLHKYTAIFFLVYSSTSQSFFGGSPVTMDCNRLWRRGHVKTTTLAYITRVVRQVDPSLPSQQQKNRLLLRASGRV